MNFQISKDRCMRLATLGATYDIAAGGVASNVIVRPDAVISIAADAMLRKVRDARVIAVDGRSLDFEETHKLGKQLGFGGYINLVEWLVYKYGVPYEGRVDWPNGQSAGTAD